MAPKGLTLKWFPLTRIFRLHLVCLSLLTIILSQAANSSADVLNNSGDPAPFKPGPKLSDIQKRLRAINKRPIKTIKSPDGDIIDCVLRYEQPAFDHPLLRNHTIQESPTDPYGSRLSSSTNGTLSHISQIWHLSGLSCPDGTIPIRRTSVEDLMRSESPRLYGKKSHAPYSHVTNSDASGPPSGYEYALAYVQGDQYYGAGAVINIWDPSVETASEFSASQMWILAGTYANSDLNTLEVGWQVSPSMYADNRPRLFTYWTKDAYQHTGCYNLLCSGFVQTDSRILVGGALSPVSTYNGQQTSINLSVWKDPKQGNWWLKYGTNINVGYWPSSLFTHLSDHADLVQWGGVVVNSHPNGGHTSTQMGSGHLAQEGFSRASFFRNLGIVDADNSLNGIDSVQTSAGFPKCYNIQTSHDDDFGENFYFGGPGRSVDCT